MVFSSAKEFMFLARFVCGGLCKNCRAGFYQTWWKSQRTKLIQNILAHKIVKLALMPTLIRVTLVFVLIHVVLHKLLPTKLLSSWLSSTAKHAYSMKQVNEKDKKDKRCWAHKDVHIIDLYSFACCVFLCTETCSLATSQNSWIAYDLLLWRVHCDSFNDRYSSLHVTKSVLVKHMQLLSRTEILGSLDIYFVKMSCRSILGTHLWIHFFLANQS